jgi:hypothetical protein
LLVTAFWFTAACPILAENCHGCTFGATEGWLIDEE